MGKYDFLSEDNEEKEKSDNKPDNKKQKNNLRENKMKEKKDTNSNSNINYGIGEIKSERDLDKYIKLYKVKENINFGPRPDLREDHYIWQKLLQIAFKTDKKVYNLLQAFRCCGCVLKMEDHKIKLDLENSEGLIELVADKDGLFEGGNGKNVEQISMFTEDNPTVQQRKREKNKQNIKKRKQMIETTIRHIKEKYLRPNIKSISKIFNTLNEKIAGPALNKVGIGYFDLMSFNDYLKREE